MRSNRILVILGFTILSGVRCYPLTTDSINNLQARDNAPFDTSSPLVNDVIGISGPLAIGVLDAAPVIKRERNIGLFESSLDVENFKKRNSEDVQINPSPPATRDDDQNIQDIHALHDPIMKRKDATDDPLGIVDGILQLVGIITRGSEWKDVLDTGEKRGEENRDLDIRNPTPQVPELNIVITLIDDVEGIL